jgi:hypothetical protein
VAFAALSALEATLLLQAVLLSWEVHSGHVLAGFVLRRSCA